MYILRKRFFLVTTRGGGSGVLINMTFIGLLLLLPSPLLEFVPIQGHTASATCNLASTDDKF